MGPVRERLAVLRRDPNLAAEIKAFMELDPAEAKVKIEDDVRTSLTQGFRRGMLSGQELTRRMTYLSNALDFPRKQHAGQKRLTGEDYIMHAYAVTHRVVQRGIRSGRIPLHELHIAAAASANHDVLEDTPTTPRELRSIIGDKGAGYVILLSKNIRAFDNDPEALRRELALINKADPTCDEIELMRWAEGRNGPLHEKMRAHMARIYLAPDVVKIIRLEDRVNNITTVPDLNVPGRSTAQEAQVRKINMEIGPETKKHHIPLALKGLRGGAGITLARQLNRAIRANQKKKDS